MTDATDTPKTGWFARLKAGLARTSARIVGGIGDVFTKKKLDEETLQHLEELLIGADLGAATATRLVQDLAKTRFGKDVDGDEVRAFFAAEIAKVLEPVARPLSVDPAKKPFVILMVGVNGAGKTTTIGKLAQLYKEQKLKSTLAAGDTFRAAAVEQLKVWGSRTGSPVIARDAGSDAASLAFDALLESKKRGDDVLLIDTAGRLHNKENLMNELQKVVRVIKKVDDTAPHATLLVLDSTIGQNAHAQVDAFKQMIGVTGLVLTKLDGTAKGGVVVALAEKFGLPIHYIGVGESAEDLRPFTSHSFARGLMGLEP
ncbi:MAG: signal recognition particle-docking protein FtsY [Rhodospirillaceae bacterium]|nr:signal recognition particle-docking protein FtsY [Rhodospirillaceae bacterium]